MRGWSYVNQHESISNIVIPANAGVILDPIISNDNPSSYPRECGGDPKAKKETGVGYVLSPRMRGWSVDTPTGYIMDVVIPANAGVILNDPGIV